MVLVSQQRPLSRCQCEYRSNYPGRSIIMALQSTFPHHLDRDHVSSHRPSLELRPSHGDHPINLAADYAALVADHQSPFLIINRDRLVLDACNVSRVATLRSCCMVHLCAHGCRVSNVDAYTLTFPDQQLKLGYPQRYLQVVVASWTFRAVVAGRPGTG